MTPDPWDLMRRRVYLWTLTLLLIAAVVTVLVFDAAQAWSLTAGALLAGFNFSLLARAAARFARAAQAAPQAHASEGGRAATAWALMRWPALALATATVLWYMPGRPEGFAAGVFVALVAFSLAALQSRSDLSGDEDQDPEPDR